MPRQPRYFVPSIPQHVLTRGVDRQPTFFQVEDFELYISALREAAATYCCAIHAYVLMTNHVHLLITPSSDHALPKLMQAMGRTYVQRLNRLYARTGALWEDRYRASPVQDATYLLSCYRYIELNPVRAGLVNGPHEYAFSSYACNALGKPDPLVTPHPMYMNLGSDREHRLTSYRRLFEDRLDANTLKQLRDTTDACLLLGNDHFKDQIELMIGRSVRPAGKAARKNHRRLIILDRTAEKCGSTPFLARGLRKLNDVSDYRHCRHAACIYSQCR